LWRWPAVLNFFLGGLGAGLYAAAALADPTTRAVASWLGPALVLAGFAAVATEAGRPLRGPRVLARARTSWMSRELWLGGAFVALAVAEWLFPHRGLRALAAAAALALALAQGFIVRRARAIPAWDVPVLPPLFGLSALVSGAGLALLVSALGGRAPGRGWLVGILALLGAGLAVWMRYLGWSSEPAFARAVQPLAHGPEFDLAMIGGYATPFALTLLSMGLPVVAPVVLALAGGLMIAEQLHFKARLILTAGRLRPVTLGGLRVPRSRGASPSLGTRSPEPGDATGMHRRPA
jgi:formate-dependent nitrite reductase membrane component NrfD